MNKKEIYDKVAELIHDLLEVDIEEEPDATLADMGADSLDAIELACDLEEMFDIEILSKDFDRSYDDMTVKDMVEYIIAKKKNNNIFEVGDKVQLTLEKAVLREIDEAPSGFDPFNDVFTIQNIHDNGNLELDEEELFEVAPKYLVKVEGKPRHIERNSEKRPSKKNYYLSIAKQVASRSTCLRRKYGAIIVKDDAIISTGYNGSPRGGHNCSDSGLCVRQVMNMAHNSGNYDLCRAVHAEQNAIINAARQGTSLLGGTLYLYGYDCIQKKTIDATPCPICGRMIENAGIVEVVSSKEGKGNEG